MAASRLGVMKYILKCLVFFVFFRERSNRSSSMPIVLRYPRWAAKLMARWWEEERKKQARDEKLLSSTQGMSHPGSQELP